MKANELRTGNYHYYHLVDKLDERKEWDEVCQIDPDDFKWLSTPKGEKDPDYKAIPLTVEWLEKLGFTSKIRGEWTIESEDSGFILEYFDGWFYTGGEGVIHGIEIKYVHQLQNFFYALTGNELTL